MPLFPLPRQLTRLVLLTIFIVGSDLLARYFLTPKSFGELGWNRAEALNDAASRPLVFAGRQACGECIPTTSRSLGTRSTGRCRANRAMARRRPTQGIRMSAWKS